VVGNEGKMEIEDLHEQLNRMERSLEADPNDFNLFSECVDLCMRVGDFVKAQNLVDEAILRNPKALSVYVERAKLQLVSGKYDEAINTLSFLKQQGFYTADILYYLVWAMLNLAQYEGVISEIEHSSQFIDEYPALILVKARALYHLHEIDAAIEALDSYLEIDQNNAEAIGLKSMLLLDSANYPEAKYYAEKAIKICPHNHEALITLSSLAPTEQGRDSEERQVKDTQPSHFMLNLGQSYLLNNEYEEAEHALKEAGSMMSHDIGTWHALAWTKILLNKTDDAKCCFEHALELDRDFSESYGGLAVIAALQKDFCLAENLTQKAIQLDPQSVAGDYAKSLILENMKQQETFKLNRSGKLSQAKDFNAGEGSSTNQKNDEYSNIVVGHNQTIH